MSARSNVQTADGTPRPAPSAPAVHPARATRCTEAFRDITEDCTVVSEALLLSAYRVGTPNTELLERLVSLRDVLDEAIGGVVRQRAQGERLADLEPIVRRTEDRLRKKYDPSSAERDLAARYCNGPSRSPPPIPRQPLLARRCCAARVSAWPAPSPE